MRLLEDEGTVTLADAASESLATPRPMPEVPPKIRTCCRRTSYLAEELDDGNN